ncbi:MAG TPA: hypothetical protein VET66_11930 [Steroidobacteraceae bacterium]|nr:hypothetical protein [Steroidobacteraceae bacterium]
MVEPEAAPVRRARPAGAGTRAAAHPAVRPLPRPGQTERAPDSHGLQKGLVGIVHAFAARAQAGGNNIVIAHELMHTVGASDKYDLGSGAPLFPQGFAAPEQQPLYPQQRAEIMAGRRALAAHDFDMPRGLAAVVVGPQTAREIRWQQ